METNGHKKGAGVFLRLISLNAKPRASSAWNINITVPMIAISSLPGINTEQANKTPMPTVKIDPTCQENVKRALTFPSKSEDFSGGIINGVPFNSCKNSALKQIIEHIPNIIVSIFLPFCVFCSPKL